MTERQWLMIASKVLCGCVHGCGACQKITGLDDCPDPLDDYERKDMEELIGRLNNEMMKFFHPENIPWAVELTDEDFINLLGGVPSD